MRLKNSILFFVMILLSSHIYGQLQVSFDDQGWNSDQSLNSGFTTNGIVFSANKTIYTNYGNNLNVNNTGIYFVFNNPSVDQIKISKSDNSNFSLTSLAAYQVSESGSGSLIVEGWNGANKLYTKTFSNLTTWQNLTLNYGNVNSVVLKTNGVAGDSLSDYDFDNLVFNSNTTAVEEPIQVREYKLDQNYPNPFNPSTHISYEIPQDGRVTLKVYDTIGNEVCTLVDEYKQAGQYSQNFNASNLASGIYIYKLSANGYISVKKMILMK